MMKKILRTIISAICAVAMLISFPGAAFADGSSGKAAPSSADLDAIHADIEYPKSDSMYLPEYRTAITNRNDVYVFKKCESTWNDGEYFTIAKNTEVTILAVSALYCCVIINETNQAGWVYESNLTVTNSIDEPAIKPLTAALTKGDIVLFGSYEQDNDMTNGKEPVEWIVLDVQDGRCLVISKFGLDCRQYNTSREDVTWETCSLRKWLNGSFLNEAFTAEEQAKIPMATVSAASNLEKDTEDQIFLLSIAEAKEYFASDAARQCRSTAYAKAQGCIVNSSYNGDCWWWLRASTSYIYNHWKAAYVLNLGTVNESGTGVDYDRFAVRPVLWVNMDPAEEPVTEEIVEPTEEPTEEPIIKQLGDSLEKGDIVLFGSYEQDNNLENGKEPIEWIILDVQDDRILVISKHTLDCQQYNTTLEDITWETCSLRAWLNDTFLNEAFSTEEQEKIPKVTVSADANPKSETNPGKDTQDCAFLLSMPESEKYFGSNAARQCKPTAYATALEWSSRDEAFWWWLRTPGYYSNTATYVLRGGAVYSFGNRVDGSYYGVRPALWIILHS